MDRNSCLGFLVVCFGFFKFCSFSGNIFISRTSVPSATSEEGDDDDWSSDRVIFKIGEKQHTCAQKNCVVYLSSEK